MEHHRLVISEQEAVECLAFLITSARCLTGEPKDYGPMRLISAAKWLSALVLPRASDQVKPLLTMLAEEIPIWQSKRRRDPEGYIAFMDECCRSIARELKRRDPESESDYD